jgi:hypothetical protein
MPMSDRAIEYSPRTDGALARTAVSIPRAFEWLGGSIQASSVARPYLVIPEHQRQVDEGGVILHAPDLPSYATLVTAHGPDVHVPQATCPVTG